MHYTVADFIASHKDSVKVLAGEQGLVRSVTEVGLLDYELVPGLKGSYQRNNFYEGQLVLTSFLYARDDSYQITDAIKYLFHKKVAALAIKNIFKLQLPDAALRYANVRGFPIIEVSDRLYFDEVIWEVGQEINNRKSAEWTQRKLDQLVLDADDIDAVVSCARELNPSMGPEHFVTYVEGAGEKDDLLRVEVILRRHGWQASDAVYPYDGGLLIVRSGEDLAQRNLSWATEELSKEAAKRGWRMGTSNTHYLAGELGQAILEARWAATFGRQHELPPAPARKARSGQTLEVHFSQLGALQALLPFAQNPAMHHYIDNTLGPLFEHDAEHNSELFKTLNAYCHSGRNLQEAARILGQHVNTVRRRLDRIAVETGLSWHMPSQMDQLSLACLLHDSQQLLK